MKKSKSVIAVVVALLAFGLFAMGSGNSSSNNSVTSNESEVKSESNDTTDQTTATEETTTQETTVDYTAGMDLSTANAFNSALGYLDTMPFSRQGLIDQLSSEYGSGFTVEQATTAVDALETYELVDWNEQAVRAAEDYLDTMSFSRQNLIDQLSSEYGSQFTVEQATYAVDQVGLT